MVAISREMIFKLLNISKEKFDDKFRRGHYTRDNDAGNIVDLLIKHSKKIFKIEIEQTMHSKLKVEIKKFMSTKHRSDIAHLKITEDRLPEKRMRLDKSYNENEMDVSSKCSEKNFIQDLTIF